VVRVMFAVGIRRAIVQKWRLGGKDRSFCKSRTEIVKGSIDTQISAKRNTWETEDELQRVSNNVRREKKQNRELGKVVTRGKENKVCTRFWVKKVWGGTFLAGGGRGGDKGRKGPNQERGGGSVLQLTVQAGKGMFPPIPIKKERGKVKRPCLRRRRACVQKKEVKKDSRNRKKKTEETTEL